MLIRNNAPVFGADSTPYSEPGQWLFNVSSRNLVSNDHYNGTAEQHERQERENYITNKQNLLDFSVTRVINRRVSVSLGVPFVFSAWAFRDPSSPLPGPRIESPQWGRGLGDISITGRSWIFDPDTHPNWNVSAGGGLKMPTGNEAYQDTFVDVKGAIPGILGNPVPGFVRREEKQYVDQSVQPGDGGWGIVTEAQAFWRVRRVFLFASGSYLINPQDTNDTPSISAILGAPASDLSVNSIPDQYLARIGGTTHVWKGFSASLAWRMEGLKRYDLIGGSHGFRRPGTAMFIEPGVSYTQGGHTFSFSVPIGYYYNRHANPYTGRPGDATFPRHIFLTSYSFSLGGNGRPPATDQPPPQFAPNPPSAEDSGSAPAPPPSSSEASARWLAPICPTR